MIQTLFGSAEKKPGLFDRMKEAVARTRENLSERIDEVVPFNKEIDRSTLDDLEGTLLGADLGSATTHQLIAKLRERADRKQIKDVAELKRLLKEELLSILTSANTPPVERPEGVRIVRGASTYLGTMFDVGPRGRVSLGDYALVHGARIICDAAAGSTPVEVRKQQAGRHQQ